MTNKMIAREIDERMTRWISENSGYQERRDYIGLSHAFLSVEEMEAK